MVAIDKPRRRLLDSSCRFSALNMESSFPLFPCVLRIVASFQRVQYRVNEEERVTLQRKSGVLVTILLLKKPQWPKALNWRSCLSWLKVMNRVSHAGEDMA